MKSTLVYTRTERGGIKRAVSTSWNSKLTKRRTGQRARIADLPAEVLCREINAAVDRFWAKRDTRPWIEKLERHDRT